MAVVLTSLATAFTRTPFIKPPDLQRELTAMPRSLVNFSLNAATLDAKPVNDQQELIVSIVLPVEFAYRMVSLTMSLIQDVARDWAIVSYLEITNGVRSLEPGTTNRYTLSNAFFSRIPSPVEMFVTSVVSMPTDILQAARGIGPVITVKCSNSNADVGAAGTVDFLMTFLEFDIEQAQRFPIHWPTMIYTRT